MTINKSICFVSPYAYPLLVPGEAGPGGAERQFFLFAKELKENGWDVSFITAYPPSEIKNKKTFFPIHTCSFRYLGGNNRRILIDWYSMLRAMKKAESHYYVLKVPGHLLAPMAVFCKLFRCHLVFWGQMSYDANPTLRNAKSIVGILHDFGLKKADITIAQTVEQQEGFNQNYNIEASIVPSICSRIAAEKSVQPTGNSNKTQIDVLWVGNSTPKKRHEVVIELAKIMPHIHFTIAMNRAIPTRFQEAQEQCASIDNLEFLGMVAPSEMEQIFPNAKIFLNTSTQEGFPNTFLQAWNSGVPVISLNIDPDHVITENRLGILIDKKLSSESYTFDALAAMLVDPITQLIIDQKERIKMGKNAQRYVARKHAPAKVTQQLEEILLRNESCK